MEKPLAQSSNAPRLEGDAHQIRAIPNAGSILRMPRLAQTLTMTAVALLAAVTAHGQQQQPQQPIRHSVVTCIKVEDGKATEFASHLQNVTSKLYKSRIDAGELRSFTIAQAYSPAGRSARCDYQLISGYDGYPVETGAPGKLDADLKRAGVNMTASEMTAKRDSLSTLVSRDVHRRRMGTGSSIKGGYLRINHYKVHAGRQADWLQAEEMGWKPIAEEFTKQGPGNAWSAHTVVMPTGSDVPYNAITVDAFPSWDALMKGNPTRATWQKVHPDRDFAAHTARVAEIADAPHRDVYRIIEVIRK